MKLLFQLFLPLAILKTSSLLCVLLDSLSETKGPKSLPSRSHGLCHSPYWPFTNQKHESIGLFNCIWRTRDTWTNCVSLSEYREMGEKRGTVCLKAFSRCNADKPRNTWGKCHTCHLFQQCYKGVSEMFNSHFNCVTLTAASETTSDNCGIMLNAKS